MASSTEDEHGLGLSLLTVLVLMAFLATRQAREQALQSKRSSRTCISSPLAVVFRLPLWVCFRVSLGVPSQFCKGTLGFSTYAVFKGSRRFYEGTTRFPAFCHAEFFTLGL